MKSIISLLFFLHVVFTTISQGLILSEDFENSSVLPSGWDEITTVSNTHWLISPVANTHYLVIPYHTNIASLNEGDNDKTFPGEFLVTPILDLTEYTSAYLSMDIFFKEMTHLNKTEEASIEASLDGGNTWINVKNINGYFNWHKVYTDVSEYCGNNAVKFAFKYNDNSGWLYGIGIDNVKVFIPFENDGAMQKINKYDFVLINDTINIKGVIQNLGINTINTFEINWSANEGLVYTENYSLQNLLPLDTFNFIHSVPWIPDTQEAYDIKVWISNINGTLDNNPANDTSYMHILNAVSEIPEKNVLLEVFGANWCTICPHASEKIAEIKDSIDNLLVAVIHIEDPFTCNVGTDIFEIYHLFPGWLVTGLINRFDFSKDVSMDMDRYLWPEHIYQVNEHISPVELAISNNYNPTTRDLDIFLSAMFHCDLSGDFRFNCYIVEDSIVGDQANCLTIQDREPYCTNENWIYNPPGIIQNYNHMNVLREVMGGPWGSEGSLPELVLEGNSYDFEFDYTIPEEYNENNIRIIGIVQKFDPDSSKCKVYNAMDMYLDSFTHDDFYTYSELQFLTYPIPAHDYLIIESKNLYQNGMVEIMTLNGSKVFNENMSDNKKHIDLSSFQEGVYIVILKNQDHKMMKKILIL